MKDSDHDMADDTIDETMSRFQPVPAPRSAEAVPIRRVIGSSPTPGRWAGQMATAVAAFGWLAVGASVFGGGFMLWQLLFGGSVGGDVWLGQPPAWVESAGADDLPGGEPWTPDTSARPGVSVVVTTAPADPSVTVTVPATAATAAATATTTQVTVAQAPTAQPGGAATPPVTATTLPQSAPTTVRTTTPSTTVATTVSTSVATTVSTSVASTTTPSTTVASTTTDVTSTTIDDDDSGGGGGGGGGGNSGKGGGGGG